MTARVGKYLLFETLGTGSFGKVKLGVHEETGDRVAIKIMDKGDIKAHEMAANVRREIAIMKALEHRNIVNLRQVLTSANKLYIVMDLVTGGELFTKIYKHGALPEPLARKYFQELVDGVSYCHSKGVYHRDLKPENLLIDEATGSLKITDFGLSTMVGANTADDLLHTMCGSPNYCAPEIISGSKTGYSGAKVDSWACGIVLFALLTGYLPFYDDNQKTLYRMIATQPPKFPSNMSEDAKHLTNLLLNKDPNRRVTVEAVKEHPWFKQSSGSVENIRSSLRLGSSKEQPRKYHFKAAAAKSAKPLTLRSIPETEHTAKAIEQYSLTKVGDKLQRYDNAVQRYRIVFSLKPFALELSRDLKTPKDANSETSVEALVVAEAMAMKLSSELIAITEKGEKYCNTSDKEFAAFEELVGMFGAHASSRRVDWVKKVGVSAEERRRVKMLVESLQLEKAGSLSNGSNRGSKAQTTQMESLTSGVADVSMNGSTTKPLTDHSRRPSQRGSTMSASGFTANLSGQECIQIVGRILTQNRYKVFIKKNENKLKCEIPINGGNVVQVTVTAVENNGLCTLSLRKSKADKDKGVKELTKFSRDLQAVFSSEVDKKIDLESTTKSRSQLN
uniref:non-specific serine/threonine protein kinase n=1 Tax=Rhodosorus marinus TaxID=101924 RepID=A0A7S3A8P5_9RHOD|mmetsp:Transcript_7441/g.33090  ORF Transcript_7441/g.33090 Transcript_7441/m.33090 type:complete len:619 (+) Transcript_7441:440-2296(+)|eukprot:CAMPEP_0113957320 /NCGR_PEP_ID=MMETSP0011_2-20120614/2701_1 /TAXON_ID=101924 /ORGANISM="Rhodosorus marinus" /LENGTH=618 /DNA_ID=CAMNT_0000967863 /DNA_START=365 /DNA_END=2221 /DNA_ORIENTATION=- /assembly_acc=CAM_ASM_000156